MFGKTFGRNRSWGRSSLVALILAAVPHIARAQSPAPKGTPSPSDVPAVKVGATIFTDFTRTSAPLSKDADGNAIHNSAFDVSRAYLTVSGGLTRRVSFRVTADIKRLTSPASTSATSLDGSQAFRLKYAYGQIALDPFLSKGSWVRIGAQQTPMIDYEEGLYRYRFQGTQMVERDGFLSSSDFGISSRLNLPNDYGDIHAGVYNGESYGKAEANDQKSLQIRGTLRPMPKHALLKGLRLTAFYNADRYVKGAPRNRLVLNAAFEHKRLVMGVDVVEARDQTSARAALVESSAYTVWARPRTTMGLEGLVRYDSFKANKSVDGRRNRAIAGVAYWFQTQSTVSVALLVDYERVTFAGTPARPREGRLALHSLFSF